MLLLILELYIIIIMMIIIIIIYYDYDYDYYYYMYFENVSGLVWKLIITVQTTPIYLPRSPPNIAIEKKQSSQSMQKAYK